MEGVEDELDRSLRLLDEAVSHRNKSLLKKSLKNINPNYSISVRPNEYSIFERSGFDQTSLFDKSVTQSIAPSVKISDGLYMGFFEILQTNPNSHEMINIVAQMSHCCADTLNIIKATKEHQKSEVDGEILQLQNERNTWRLLYVLYSDRLDKPSMSDDENESCIYYGPSEKFCMLSLFKRDSLLRESQLVIDWLECNAAEADDETLHFSDCSMGWENTLHQLKSKETIVFESTRQIVDKLDPDAPHYQQLPLHDIDIEDDKRLCHQIFHEIRCGKLIEAQKLCQQSGHSWRAAQLEGWKLFHNPNLTDPFTKEYEEQDADEGISETTVKSVEGNKNRDLWKVTAWKYCNFETLNKFEKATVASFCGYLLPLLNVCESWEDYLWAYMKVMVDIRVENELREYVTKTYKPMPEAYWEQRMSINEIFNSLEACKNKTVQNEALSIDHIIQKYIILDEIAPLLDHISEWILDSKINPQFLRFLTHLLLFLESIDQVTNREVVQRVIEEYVKKLIGDKQTQLVAYYASHLGQDHYVKIYASYLESFTANEDRKEALKYAEDAGLNVYAITKQIVENICSRHDDKSHINNLITEMDKFKISSLDWLYFYECQLADAVQHTNYLIFQFLVLNKVSSAQFAFAKVPPYAVQKLKSAGDMPEELEKILKEFLSYKMYLNAHETFNVWFQHLNSKPIAPIAPPSTVPLTKRVEYEHKLGQYESEMGRWQLTFGQLSKSVKDHLYNVLLFPDGGWLNGAKNAHYLQKTCIPESTNLLYKVLYASEQYQECVQLADILASKKYKLYKHFTRQRLTEILGMLCDASMALVKQGKDPWGIESRA